MTTAITTACLVLLNYYATTLMIWMGHYLPHRAHGRLREFHMGGHHALYPDSLHTRTASFQYGSGWNDSLVPMLPWLVALASTQWLMFPWPRASLGTLEITLIAAAHSFLHAQFHVFQSPLEGLAWFRRARSIHSLHHDRDVNFMVGDHFWDRVCGTFKLPSPSCSFSVDSMDDC
jgi:sterol desaturase/sphingolipid hydroxylase (fatty acid hydroxylase superfamily)